MCRTLKSTRWPLAIAILTAFCIMAPPTAFGQQCQASAALPIFPQGGATCETGVLQGGLLDTIINVTNTSTTTGGAPVDAHLQGTVTVTLAAGDVFVPGPVDGCVAHAAGVAGCASGGGNLVLITMTTGVPLPAATSVPIATITLSAGASTGCDIRPILAGTAADGIITDDADCDDVTGGGQGSSNYRGVECLVDETCGTSTDCTTVQCVEFACQTTNATPSTHCGDVEDTDCQTHSCNDAGACVTTNTTPSTHCGDVEDTDCQTHSCNDAGACVTTNTTPSTHCGDVEDTECQTHSCNDAGECVTNTLPEDTVCNVDQNLCCTADGLCTEPCVPEVCRTPGFWATHAGTEKQNSVDITGLVLQYDGVVEICGQTLDNTLLDSISSAEEALCVHVKDGSQLQLARQLTAAALNCLVNGHLADCSNDPLFGTWFAACNTEEVCGGSKEVQTGCIDAIDCLNNGGHPGLASDGKFLCASGVCSDNPDALCTPDNLGNCTDPATATCTPSANCHLEPLPGFEPPGPAGSSKKCNDANQNDCTIFSCP